MVSKKRVIKYLEKIIGSSVISQMQKIALLVTTYFTNSAFYCMAQTGYIP